MSKKWFCIFWLFLSLIFGVNFIPSKSPWENTSFFLNEEPFSQGLWSHLEKKKRELESLKISHLSYLKVESLVEKPRIFQNALSLRPTLKSKKPILKTEKEEEELPWDKVEIQKSSLQKEKLNTEEIEVYFIGDKKNQGQNFFLRYGAGRLKEEIPLRENAFFSLNQKAFKTSFFKGEFYGDGVSSLSLWLGIDQETQEVYIPLINQESINERGGILVDRGQDQSFEIVEENFQNVRLKENFLLKKMEGFKTVFFYFRDNNHKWAFADEMLSHPNYYGFPLYKIPESKFSFYTKKLGSYDKSRIPPQKFLNYGLGGEAKKISVDDDRHITLKNYVLPSKDVNFPHFITYGKNYSLITFDRMPFILPDQETLEKLIINPRRGDTEKSCTVLVNIHSSNLADFDFEYQIQNQPQEVILSFWDFSGTERTSFKELGKNDFLLFLPEEDTFGIFHFSAKYQVGEQQVYRHYSLTCGKGIFSLTF